MRMTLSKSQRQFANINNQAWYDTQYQRNIINNLIVNHELPRRRHLSATLIWSSGIPITYPEGFSIAHSDNFFTAPLIIPVYINKHNARTPNYFRVDFQYRKEYETRNGKIGSIAVGVYNASGRQNPLTLDIRPEYQPIVDDQKPSVIKGKLTKTTLFNFIPFISIGRKF
ncbi:MAG: hypothetical protein KDC53_19945 [Saprospiraceae bacterium]|nr:hypothetical protein [Saprospiraceae bacterium]